MTLAMSGATPEDAGLASGLINTTAQVGGALGLAVLATLSSSRTESLLEEGKAVATALTSGYHVAFWIGAGLVVAAIVVAATVLEKPPKEAQGSGRARSRRTRSRLARWRPSRSSTGRAMPPRAGIRRGRAARARPRGGRAGPALRRRVSRPGRVRRGPWSTPLRDRRPRRRPSLGGFTRRWWQPAPGRPARADLRDGPPARRGRGDCWTTPTTLRRPRADDDEIALFLHDLPPEQAPRSARQGAATSPSPRRQPWPLDAWPDVPTRYLLCRDDRWQPADGHGVVRTASASSPTRCRGQPTAPYLSRPRAHADGYGGVRSTTGERRAHGPAGSAFRDRRGRTAPRSRATTPSSSTGTSTRTTRSGTGSSSARQHRTPTGSGSAGASPAGRRATPGHVTFYVEVPDVEASLARPRAWAARA